LSKSIKQLTKNLFSLTLVQIATYVLPLISVPIVSRIIGPEKYGTINFAVAYVAYFTLLISYSFDFSATRKISKDPDNIDNRNKVFSEVFYTQCLLFFLSTITFVILLFTVTQLKENKAVVIFSYLLCVSTLFTQNWLFQAMQDLSKVALFNLISKVLFTVAILIVVRKNQDYIWQPLIISVVQAMVAIWSFTWAFKKYKIRLIKPTLLRCWEVLKEERIIFFSLVFVNLYSSTNTVILGLFQNATQVGYYTAAQRLIIIAQSVLAMPLAQAFYPFIGKAFGEGKDQGLRIAQKLIPLIVVFLGLATIAMFVLGPFVIRIFYGHRFEEAIPAFQILTIVPLLFSLNNVLGIQIMLNLGMD
jgi:O-antigen/teichoic acid export membrane protein